ncbi:MAG: hypothetical protein HDQ99_20550 [Lachnospiraceae bacterium]|nr:hypothetical protein [Lachnospiraceae bacterium]
MKIGILKSLLFWVENNMTLAQTFGTLASAVCALFMAVFTVINLWLSFTLKKKQEKYNIAALCPTCDVVCSETNDRIKISIANYGHGTMIIDHLDIINKETSSVLHNMYEIIPESIGLKYYSTETRGRNIRVDGHIKLVEIDLKKLTAKGYAKIRRNLAKYTITVHYQGIYDQGVCRQVTKDLSELFGHTYRDPYKKRGILSSRIKLPEV